MQARGLALPLSQENPLWISWHDTAWIAVLNPSNVMDYFMEKSNPFYDRTCNNEIVKMQRQSFEQLKYELFSFICSFWSRIMNSRGHLMYLHFPQQYEWRRIHFVACPGPNFVRDSQATPTFAHRGDANGRLLHHRWNNLSSTRFGQCIQFETGMWPSCKRSSGFLFPTVLI